MIYPIKILQAAIDTHQKAIDKLIATDAESMGDQYFIEDEVRERKEYIRQIKDAVSLLDGSAVPLAKLKEGAANV